MHLLRIHKLVERIKPKVVVFDPLSNYLSLGNDLEVQSMLTRLLDYLKGLQITSIFNTLVEGGHAELQSEVGVSSLMDVWILLRNLEYNGERNRGLFILKARGIAHSNQIREFIFTDHATDTIERIRTVEELRKSEQLYRAIGDSIPYGIWIANSRGRNIYLSDSFCALTGLQQSDWVDSGWMRTLHPDDAESTRVS